MVDPERERFLFVAGLLSRIEASAEGMACSLGWVVFLLFSIWVQGFFR